MTAGSDALAGAYAKLDRAEQLHQKMHDVFERLVREDEPYTMQFESLNKPAGMVIARFKIDKPIPHAMSVIAGDVVHNARVAIDHTLARLKDHFGGVAGQGSFPICSTADQWQARVVNRGKKSPLARLEGTPAFDLIHDEQPMHRADPANDPLVVLNRLDNVDKHELLQIPFVYPADKGGLDLIEIIEPKRVKMSTSVWQAASRSRTGPSSRSSSSGDGSGHPPVQARRDARIGFAVGELGRARCRSPRSSSACAASPTAPRRSSTPTPDDARDQNADSSMN